MQIVATGFGDPSVLKVVPMNEKRLWELTGRRRKR